MSTWRILIVDDDQFTTALLSRAVRDLGLVETAANGREALQRLETAPLPDLILLDALMPELSGFEVCAQLKANPRLADIPIIFVTGQSDQETEIQALSIGAVDFISKPITLPVVKARVHTQLTLLEQKHSLKTRIAEQSSEIDLLLNSISDPVWIKNLAGAYITANPATLRAFELSVEEVIGYKASDLFPSKVAQQSETEDQEIIRTGKQRTFDLETCSPSSGQVIHWEITKTPVKNSNGESTGILAIARDVTLRKKTEHRLAMLSLAVEQNPNTIIITDSKTDIEYVNAAFVRTSGYSSAEAIGQKAGFYRSGKTPAITFPEIKAALIAGEAWKGCFYNQTRDGTELINIAHVSPIRNAEGEVTHFLSIQEDITEHERLTAEISQTRAAQQIAEAASEAKSTFLANMSHEIRTPMNAIIGLTHLLRDDSPTPSQENKLNKIAAAAKHLLGIINDILDISKIEAGRMEMASIDFSMAEVMNNVYGQVAERVNTKGLCFTTSIATLPPVLHGDAMRLTQILLNFIGNAVKFTPSGSISLTGKIEEESEDGFLVRFTIEDTGIGIHADHLPRMFQAFEQADNSTSRKFGGTGLGLRINRHLAQMMGGEVGVSSTPDAGSCFWATLRLGKSATPHLKSPSAAPSGDVADQLTLLCSGSRILLAEDNPINQEVSLTLLKKVGIEADLAEDGAKAVAAASASTYDLILMDMQMPEMDGLAATRAIRRLPGYATTPIVAMTANAFDDDRQACFSAGMNDHIAKPVDPQKLYATMLKWLTAEPVPVTQSGQLPATESHFPLVPALDYALGLKQMSGNVAVYEKLLSQFAADAERDQTKLRQHLANGEADKARRLAHSLKGSAGTLGAQHLHEICAALEDSIRRTDDMSVIDAQLDDLAAALKAMASAIDVALDRKPI